MGFVIDGTLPRDVGGGQTGKERLSGFVNVRTEGIRDLAAELLKLAFRADENGQSLLQKATKDASKSIIEAYRNNINDVTGNLGRSVETRKSRGQKLPGIATSVTGPVHRVTNDEWDVSQGRSKKGGGNHGWLVEFGTGPRRPGTQGRRTLVNLHDKVNTKFTKRSGVFNDEDFARMSTGEAYFVMGSKNEPTRKGGAGRGYPHDILFYIGPGETYGAMPAQRPMEKAIASQSSAVLASLMSAIQTQVLRLSR